MITTDKPCFICKERAFVVFSKHYLKCVFCNHEINRYHKEQGFMVNEALLEDRVRRKDFFDKFKRRLLKKCIVRNDFLLDVGSGSGKFLYHSKNLFKKCAGIEVQNECVYFARNQLGLKIEKDILAVNDTISVATFWHSLEHMPIENIGQILRHINCRASFDTRIVISVPNNDSLQYKIFKEDSAYYDPANHIHQFSVKSLDRLMEEYGFVKQRSFYSFIYSCFGYLQGFLNECCPIHNYLYYGKKRGETFGKTRGNLLFYDVYNFLLAVLFIIPALLFSIFDFIYQEKGGLITACYIKKKN